ncbi:MAG TPA: 2Fe-2S iron-sulfur cluster-binding protein [Nitrospiria bacterium]|jgi:2Fe-2S ferredoxin
MSKEKKTYKITFLPVNRTVETEEERSVLDLALDHHIELEHNCGGNCACATCHVIVKQGMEFLSPKTEEEEDQLEDADGLTLDSRLACQAIVKGDVVVEIPSENKF